MSAATPIVSSPNPSRIDALATRRLPARLPVRSATPNIVRESGAIERPASIALYSKTICR